MLKLGYKIHKEKIMQIEDLIENFELLEDWEDKYRYIIDLGSNLAPLDEKFKTEEWKVRGCQSQVWLVPEKNDGKLSFKGDSDAVIVKGLISIVLTIFNNKTPSEIAVLEIDDVFSRLGLEEHLSPSRRNGLFSMVEKIKLYARSLQD